MLLAQYFRFRIFPLSLDDVLLYVACATDSTSFLLTCATLHLPALYSTADQRTALLYIDKGPNIHRYAATSTERRNSPVLSVPTHQLAGRLCSVMVEDSFPFVCLCHEQ